MTSSVVLLAMTNSLNVFSWCIDLPVYWGYVPMLVPRYENSVDQMVPGWSE